MKLFLLRALWALVSLPAVGCFLYLAMGRLMKIRDNILRKVFLLFMCGISVAMPIYLADWGNILPTLGVFLLAVWFTCEGSGLKRISIGFMFASIVFAFNAIMDNWVTDFDMPFRRTMLERLLFGGVLYVALRRFSPGNTFELSPAMWKLMLLLTITPAGIVLDLVLLSSYTTPRDTFQIFVLLLLALFSFVGILWTALVLARQQKLEQEAMAAQMNRKYYEAVEQQNYEIRRLRHDMANHLQTLSTLSEEQKEEYIRELLDAPGFSKVLKYCGDDTVNAVLSIKASLMEQNGIDFHVRTGITEALPMEKPDTCAIFGNALDNAIEAVCKLSQEERRISMEARLAKGMFVLRVENSCGSNEYGKENEGFFSTTKKDKTIHGFGLPSIREAVEKYGGHLETKQEDGRFVLLAYCNTTNGSKR